MSRRPRRPRRPRHPLRPALAALVVPVLLSGCGSDDTGAASGTGSPVDTVVETSGDPTTGPVDPTTAADPDTEVPTGAAPALCDVLTADDVASVLGAPGSVATSLGFGGSDTVGGGQCVWTTDADGDPYSATAVNLELVVWLEDDVNPAPPEAPAPGSDEVVTEDGALYFATDANIWALRVTGGGATPDALDRAVDLVDVVRAAVA